MFTTTTTTITTPVISMDIVPTQQELNDFIQSVLDNKTEMCYDTYVDNYINEKLNEPITDIKKVVVMDEDGNQTNLMDYLSTLITVL